MFGPSKIVGCVDTVKKLYAGRIADENNTNIFNSQSGSWELCEPRPEDTLISPGKESVQKRPEIHPSKIDETTTRNAPSRRKFILPYSIPLTKLCLPETIFRFLRIKKKKLSYQVTLVFHVGDRLDAATIHRVTYTAPECPHRRPLQIGSTGRRCSLP